VQIFPLDKGSIDYVMANLSDMCIKEAQDFGLSIQDLEAVYVSMIGKPFTGAFYGDDGECCAIIALELTGMLKWKSHFATTEKGLTKVFFELTRFLLRFSDDIIKRGGEITIKSAYSAGRTYDWFIGMGFKYVTTEGNVSTYIKRGA